jgi:hypothetical protein
MATASTPPPPKKRTELDIEKVVIPRTPPQVITEEELAPAPEEHLNAEPPEMHKNAQSAQSPISRESPKVGRNEPCPCGSGQKYKRCCLGKPPKPLQAAAAGNSGGR